ncbi:hypothetical protein [Pyrodictium delaneyi]|uniref:Uncharacterized protein n=1 Tax=Pyrodictium delaneyi TaxID=1273541 RepID=A0A211YRC8_9CREN|nr:hypothetical protein [Pyrodictium delaneyi]OWJ55603.1 hypothetical protein Pdsh_02110 [Pyrodictium delaneyi]
MAGERWAGERRNAALAAANTIIPRLAGAARGMGLRVRVDASKDHRVYVLVIDLPGSRSLAVGLYVTTEESRPIPWSRLWPRVARLSRTVAAHAPPGSDTLLFLVPAAPRARPTGPARRRLAGERVGFLAPRELQRWLNRYLGRRLAGLIRRLREKGIKAYGKLAELLRALHRLASALGPVDISLHEVEAMIRA